MKIESKQDGFGYIETFLVLIIVILIGVVGFMVYKNHHKTKNNTVSATTSKTQSKTLDTKQQNVSVANTPTAAVQPSVSVDQWSIKLSFDDADKVTYKITTDDSGAQYASLYLKDSVATVCQDLGVGLARSSTGAGNKVGNYYYQIEGGPGACSDDPGGANGSINQLRSKITSTELGSGKYTVAATQ